MRILFVGDIVGGSGRGVFKALSPNIIEKYKIDFVIVNGENSAGGFGINEKVATELFKSGAHVITGGNHIWDKKEAVAYLAKEGRVLRPANYPPGTPGSGSVVLKVRDGLKAAVINIAGRVFMSALDCPFRTAQSELEELRKETSIIIVDFHAEATSEKIAMGQFLNGQVSAVLGTHTHVQTADEKILDKGTAYITDVGMTGPMDSIIGIEKDIIIKRFVEQMPIKFETATGPGQLNAVVVEIDEKTGRANAIQRLQLKHP